MMVRGQDQSGSLEHSYTGRRFRLMGPFMDLIREKNERQSSVYAGPNEDSRFRRKPVIRKMEPQKYWYANKTIVAVGFQKTVSGNFRRVIVVLAKGMDQRGAKNGRIGVSEVVGQEVNHAREQIGN